ncbi:MAG: putative RNA methyltransferase [Thiobacillus sp.]
MHITPFQALACPLDGLPLQPTGSAWRCASGHNFDIASQGYTHLLPVQHKRSRDPGDSKAMIAARRRFLSAGFYQPIATAVSQAMLDNVPGDARLNCLDAGCGEGYYLSQLAATAQDEQTLALLGLDISKWAVLAAAKQDTRATWVVGSNANLPVLTGTLDRLLCLFGFPVYAEFARVLKPGGLLVQVDAGPDHLRALRETIYPSLKLARQTEPTAPPGFSRRSPVTLRYSIDLTHTGQIADLLTMTPHLYRASAEGRARAVALTQLALDVDVRITCFERNHR